MAEKKKKKQEEDISYYKEQLQRVQAEFENYRRRTEEESLKLKDIYTSNLIQKLLPIMDNFEMALEHKCADENYSMGIQMIYNYLKSFFESEGLQEIDAINNKFDSNTCEAVEVICDNEKEDGIVLKIKHKGYKLNDKVVRRAKVIVNKKESKKTEEK